MPSQQQASNTGNILALARNQIKAKRSPADFAEIASNGKYKRPWHVNMLNDALMDVYNGNTLRLIITMPPRHSKSETVSKHTTAWWLGMRPDDRVMLTSYEHDLAASWGGKARNLLIEHGGLFGQEGIEIRDDSKASNRWDIVGHDGGMVTMGVGGALTGKGANLLVIDDYLRNSEDARSKLIRDKQWDWWTGTVRERLEPSDDGRKPGVIILATRWHEDDLIGHLLEQDAEDGVGTWKILALPAIATYDEEYRKEGEALWPARFPLEELEAIRRDIGTYWFSAEYQCTPSPEDGLHFKRSGVRYWRKHPDGYMLLQANGTEVFMKDSRCWKFITVDLAASEKETADYTVIACWAVTPNTEMILVDLVRERLPGPDKIPAIKKMLAKYGAQYVAIEKTGFQLDFVKNARAAGLPCLELVAKGDKVERAIESTIKWESGMIFIPQNASWTSAYEEELYTFNAGRHDDQVDVTAYAAIEVGKRGFASNYAYGLIECSRCKKLYTCTKRTGLDRPCPQCGMVQESASEDSFEVPAE